MGAVKQREHELKVWPSFYAAIRDGSKRFEVRSTRDRDFAVGDALLLREYDPHEAARTNIESSGYSGRAAQATITYVMPGGRFGIDEGTVVLGFGEPRLGSFYDDEFYNEEPEPAE